MSKDLVLCSDSAGLYEPAGKALAVTLRQIPRGMQTSMRASARTPEEGAPCGGFVLIGHQAARTKGDAGVRRNLRKLACRVGTHTKQHAATYRGQ
jgi:hypothetical protein